MLFQVTMTVHIPADANPTKITSLRWLQRDPPDVTEARKGTERIVEAGTLASEIINRLRSLYKGSPPKRELVDVNEMVRESVSLLRDEANLHAVSLRTELAADLPKITADRVQIQQVLMNLMLNGIEAMRETGGILTVKSQLGQDGRILIVVSDTGVGLPAEKAGDLQRLLYHEAAGLRHGPGDQPFYRRVAWWPFVGHGERRTGSNVSFHVTRRRRGIEIARYRTRFGAHQNVSQ
jgi:signal transduction histidine kinase